MIDNNDTNGCPKCESMDYIQSRCPRRQRECNNCGEVWHVCSVHSTIVLGPSPKMKPLTSCTCQIGEILRVNPMTNTIY
ncbi:MAG: hypothetical protein KAS32_30285 [Candidatus Peribacteraceae bacterium]|nr:hypothetical protein [Candidatus Peribacteraceae bacterium]